MTVPTRLPTGLNVVETVRAAGYLLNEGGTPILTSAMGHNFVKAYAQNAACPGASDATIVLHVVKGAAGTIRTFVASCTSVCVGDSTISVDLKKDGVSILSAAISLSSSQSNYDQVSATISSTSVAAGDVLTVVVTVSEGTGTLGTGLFAEMVLDEDYSA